MNTEYSSCYSSIYPWHFVNLDRARGESSVAKGVNGCWGRGVAGNG